MPDQKKSLEKFQLKMQILDKFSSLTPAQKEECLRNMAGFGYHTLQYVLEYGLYDDPTDFVHSMSDLKDSVDVTN